MSTVGPVALAGVLQGCGALSPKGLSLTWGRHQSLTGTEVTGEAWNPVLSGCRIRHYGRGGFHSSLFFSRAWRPETKESAGSP